MSIQFTANVFRERDQFVSHAPELDVSSCGASDTEAEKNLMEAVRLFLEEAGKMGTLEQVLEEAGYVRREGRWEPPELVRSERPWGSRASDTLSCLPTAARRRP